MIKISPSSSIKVEQLLYALSCGRDLKISRKIVKNLEVLETSRPTYFAFLARELTALCYLAIDFGGVSISKVLPDLRDLRGIDALVRYIRKDGVLEIRRRKTVAPFEGEGLLFEPEHYALFDGIREYFQHSQDEEICNLSLYASIWEIRMFLYEQGRKKGSAKRDENLGSLVESNTALLNAAGVLNEMALRFPFGTQTYRENYRDSVETASLMLRTGRNAAADATLVGLTERIEKDIRYQEQDRLASKGKTKAIDFESYQGDLVQLAENLYGIKFMPDGTCVVPQKGYRKKGKVYQKDLIESKVEQEKAARREGHKIEGIEKWIAINESSIGVLDSIAAEIMANGKLDHEKYKDELGKLLEIYKKRRVPLKFQISLIIGLAQKLLRVAACWHEEKAKEFQLNFAVAMLQMAARKLAELNFNLRRQVERIAPKQQLLELIVSQNAVGDSQMRNLSQFILYILKGKMIFNLPGTAWWLLSEIGKRVKHLGITGFDEPGIVRCLKRIKEIRRCLGVIGGVNRKRKEIRESIKEERKEFMDRQSELKASKQFKELESLKKYALERFRRNLEEIEKRNGTIGQNLIWAAREALLILFDLENKNREVSLEMEQEYIQEHEDVFNKIISMNSGYMEVVDGRGNVVGKALPYDIKEAELKTKGAS